MPKMSLSKKYLYLGTKMPKQKVIKSIERLFYKI